MQNEYELLEDLIQQKQFVAINEIKVSQINTRNSTYRKSLASKLPPNLSSKQLSTKQKCENALNKLEQIGIYLNELLEVYDLSWMEQTYVGHITHQRKTFKIRQNQLFMLLFLIENRHKEDFLVSFTDNFGSLAKFAISNPSQPLNHFIIHGVLKKQNVYHDDFCKYLKSLEISIQKKDYKQCNSLIKHCKIVTSKISTIIQVFPYACVLRLDDLFSENLEESLRWKRLIDREVIKITIMDTQIKVNQAFDEIRQGLNFVNASMNQINQINKQKNPLEFLKKSIEGGMHIFGTALFKSKAKKQAQLMISQPDKKLAKQIWNLPEQALMKNLVEGFLPSVKYSRMIYLPREFPEFSRQMIVGMTKNRDFNTNNEALAYSVRDLQSKLRYGQSLFEQITITSKRIPVRINSDVLIDNINVKKQKNFFSAIQELISTKLQYKQQVILHIHGGGFISMSSHIHQMYSRRWVNDLKVPIFSLDYRKAPENPYPAGLDDCLQVYLWMLHYMKQVFNIVPKKIILVGDSAGGNLVAALTSLLIKFKLRVPDGIVLVYPALNLNYDFYTPSLLNSLDDLILPHTFLKICLESYIQHEGLGPEIDPFLSPIQSSNNILCQYPPTRIFVGNNDPFHDDCCRLTEKLHNLGRDVKLTIYDCFPHGFLQFDNPPKFMKYCKTAIKEVEIALGQLLKL